MTRYIPTNQQTKIRKRTFNVITVVLSANSQMPVIRGKWERLQSGRIRARYTPDEYAQCLKLLEVIRDAKETA